MANFIQRASVTLDEEFRLAKASSEREVYREADPYLAAQVASMYEHIQATYRNTPGAIFELGTRLLRLPSSPMLYLSAFLPLTAAVVNTNGGVAPTDAGWAFYSRTSEHSNSLLPSVCVVCRSSTGLGTLVASATRPHAACVLRDSPAIAGGVFSATCSTMITSCFKPGLAAQLFATGQIDAARKDYLIARYDHIFSATALQNANNFRTDLVDAASFYVGRGGQVFCPDREDENREWWYVNWQCENRQEADERDRASAYEDHDSLVTEVWEIVTNDLWLLDGHRTPLFFSAIDKRNFGPRSRRDPPKRVL